MICQEDHDQILADPKATHDELREVIKELREVIKELQAALIEATDALETLRRGHGTEVSAACYPALNNCRAVLAKVKS